jgi:Na+-translocating ferredoxin:NAD+ oxidoreductase RnfE subunit
MKDWLRSYYMLFAPATLAGFLLGLAGALAITDKVGEAVLFALCSCACLVASGWAMNLYTQRIDVKARCEAYIKVANVLAQDAANGHDPMHRIKEILREVC